MPDELKKTVEAAKEEVKNAISSRFNSPFLGPFLISWIAWNHRLVFALFSGGTLKVRFDYIDNVLYPTMKAFALLNFLGPLASTIFYILVLPWITELVDWCNEAWERRRQRKRLEWAQMNPMGPAESLKLRAQNAEFRRIDAERGHEIARLRNMLAGWKAMTLASAGDGSGAVAIEELLKSQPFNFLHPDKGWEVQAVLSFRSGGFVEWKTIEEAPYSNANTYRLQGPELTLRADTGSVLAKFRFNPSECIFVGEGEAQPRYLQPAGFLVRDPNDYR